MAVEEVKPLPTVRRRVLSCRPFPANLAETYSRASELVAGAFEVREAWFLGFLDSCLPKQIESKTRTPGCR
jgi:hypothetical protein